jgi:hypothetical protein
MTRAGLDHLRSRDISKDSCYICCSTKKLKPMKSAWTMFDGTPVEIDIFKCKACLKELKELESFTPGTWLAKAHEKMMPKIITAAVPVMFALNSGIL